MVCVRGGMGDLDTWLVPFLDVLGRKTRPTWAPLHLRGLLGPGKRKSLLPKQGELSVGVARQYCGELGK